MKTFFILAVIIAVVACQRQGNGGGNGGRRQQSGSGYNRVAAPTADRDEKIGDDCTSEMCQTTNPLSTDGGNYRCCDSSKYTSIEEYYIPCGDGERCSVKDVCSCL